MINWLLKTLDFNKVIFDTSILSTNISLCLKTSLIANLFVLMVVFLYIITTIYSIGYLTFERDKRKPRFHILTALSVLTTICLAYSNNLFTAFIFYDLLSVCTYMLVKHHGDEESEKHALIYALYLLIPSMLFLLPAIIIVYNIAEHTDFVVGGILSQHPISKSYVNIIFLMFMYGISKTALYPLHKWLIHAMVAPSPVSALLHAVLVVKGGLFLLYKVIVETFGLEFLQQNIYTISNIPFPVYIAGFGIVMAGVSAIASDNIKQRLAYSTISQIGYISMCFFCFTKESIFAGQMQFLAHSITKISLFYYAGYLLARYHTTKISELKFERNHFNIVLSILWIIPTLSLMSMPFTAGFISKHAIVGGTIHLLPDIKFFILIFVGMLLCILYLYPILYHLISFNNHIKRFTGQYFSTFCVYFSVAIISICIILLFFILNNIH